MPGWLKDVVIIIGSLAGIVIGIALLTAYVLLPLYEHVQMPTNINGVPITYEPPLITNQTMHLLPEALLTAAAVDTAYVLTWLIIARRKERKKEV